MKRTPTITAFLLICSLLCSLLFMACSGDKHEDNAPADTDEPALVRAVPTTTINMRQQPFPDANITTRFGTADTLQVLSPAENGEWIYVLAKKGGQGYEGFVSENYVTYIGPNTVDQLPLTDDMDESERNRGAIEAAAAEKAKDAVWPIWLIVTLAVISSAVCVSMSEMYNYRSYLKGGAPSVWPGYIAVALSLGALAYVCWSVLQVRTGSSRLDLYFAAMVLSVGAPAAVIPWRIRISGLDSPRDRDKELNARVLWGYVMASLGWLALLVPLCYLALDMGHPWTFAVCEDTFWNMVLFMVVYAVVGIAFAKVIWPWGVVNTLFGTMPSTVLWWLDLVVCYVLFRFAHGMLYDAFSGFNYLAGLFLGFCVSCLTLGVLYGDLAQLRCVNCHSFAGEHEGTTDQGYDYSTSDEWRSISNSSVNSRYGGEVSDAEARVRVTKATHRWQTHHRCAVCGEHWDLNHSHSKDVDEQVMEKRWTETR